MEHQTKNRQQGTITISRAVNSFLLSVLVIFTFFVLIIIATVGDKEFQQMQQNERQNKVNLISGVVETYVDNRLNILSDLAKLPLIKQTVMQPQRHKADLADFMSTLSILNTKPQMILLDFEGLEIHKTQQNPSVDFTAYDWVLQIAEGTKSQHASIIQLPSGAHWCIATPVLHHGQPEGVLVSLISLEDIKNTKLFLALEKEEIEILQDETLLARFGTDNIDGFTQQIAMERFNITLQYTGTQTEILDIWWRILSTIAGLLLLISIPLAIFTAIIVRKWFIKPILKLREASYGISNNRSNATDIFTKDSSKIEELVLLGKDLDLMAQQINMRQEKLEQQVQERTKTLNTQKERFSNIIEATDAGTWQWNVKTGETTFNEKWATTIGYTLDEISPTSIDTWIKFAHPDDLKRSNALLEKHFKGELDYYHFEGRMKHKNGSWVWVLDRGRVITRDDNGNPILVYGTHQDITKQKELDIELEKRREMLSEIMIFTRTDTKGVITEVSDAFCAVSGYSREELIGKTHNILKGSLDEQNELFNDLWETIKNGDVWKGEIKNETKNGDYFWTEITIYPEFDDNSDKIKGYYATRREITAEKDSKNQKALLIEQSKMASLGEMIGNIAHQWRQPLSVITTSSSSMDLHYQMDSLTKENMSFFNKSIIENAEYLSKTIDTFKNFIKGDSQEEDIKADDLIENSLNIIKYSYQNNNIELINNVASSDAPTIKQISVQLFSQVVINILNNSKDILKEKDIQDPWVKIDSQTTNDTITITIEDNGKGIPDDILPKIFNPYFTTKHESQGTGLGLYMSYKIITENIKGKLYARNTENGAKFFIEVPLEGTSK